MKTSKSVFPCSIICLQRCVICCFQIRKKVQSRTLLKRCLLFWCALFALQVTAEWRSGKLREMLNLGGLVEMQRLQKTCGVFNFVFGIRGWVQGKASSAALPLACHLCSIHCESSRMMRNKQIWVWKIGCYTPKASVMKLLHWENESNLSNCATALSSLAGFFHLMKNWENVDVGISGV